MTRARQLFWLVSLGALCLGARPAPIANDLALDYQSPPGCPAEAELRDRTADLFDFDDPFVRAGAPASMRVHVEISRRQQHFHAKISLHEAGGTLAGSTYEEGVSCDSLVWMIAHRLRLIIIRRKPPDDIHLRLRALELQLDPLQNLSGRLDRVEENAEEAARERRALQQQIAELNRAIIALRRNKMDLTTTLSAGFLLTANLSSTVGPGVWLGGDLRIDPLSLGLELRSVLPARFEVGPYDNDQSQFVALLTPCGRYSVFFGCAVAGAGFQLNYDSNYHPDVTPAGYNALVQLGGRAGVEIPLGESRFALRGWAEVLYSTPPLTFTYSVGNTVVAGRDRPDVSAFFGLGLVVKLGEQGAK